MTREYQPIFSRRTRDDTDLVEVRRLFAEASRPYLLWPWAWVGWAMLLPSAALATEWAADRHGPLGVLVLWSAAILAGGAGEVVGWHRAARRDAPGAGGTQDARRDFERSGLAAWVMRTQGNLSLVAVAFSALLVARSETWAIPAVWLLLLGHSLYGWGGLSLPAWRRCGILYQIGGVVALWPPARPLWIFALVTFLGNAEVARAIFARLRSARSASRRSATD